MAFLMANRVRRRLVFALLLLGSAAQVAVAAKKEPKPYTEPKLPGGKSVVTDASPELLQPTDEVRKTLQRDVTIAQTPPTIDFLYFPGQTYAGKPWSVWGDGVATSDRYFTAVGDHLGPAGNAFVFSYDPKTKTLKELCNLDKLLNRPAGHYSPAKIHSRIDLGSDGWLYFGTHRGSPQHTNEKFHYEGDWIVRCHPETGKSEVVAHAPVPYHAIPASQLDPERLIFYGGTASGVGKEINFFAYDVKHKKLLHAEPHGPYRAMILAKSTGKVYYTQVQEYGPLRCFDPASGQPPQKLKTEIGLRTATEESADGFVYTVASNRQDRTADLWAFNTKTEKAEKIGRAEVGGESYITSLDLDPTGRYLYYSPGAHGSGPRAGTPIVQYDLKTHKKKILAFLDPFYTQKYNCKLIGTFSTALSPAGDVLYATWNAGWNGDSWNVTALTAIHIPESERRP